MKTKRVTVQDVLDILASQSAKQEILTQQISDFAKQMAESKAEAEKRNADFEADLKKSRERADKEMREVRQELGGFGKSQGELAERYFQKAIQRNMKLLHVDISEMDNNVSRFSKKLNLREEYDLVLTNSDVVILVEIKHKLRSENVEKFYSQKIPNFRRLFPEKKDYQILGAVAAFLFEEDSQELAEKYGFFILTKANKELEILNENYISY